MTTKELVERLRDFCLIGDPAVSGEAGLSQCPDGWWVKVPATDLRAVASRLSAMEAENKRLREALTFTREALFSALAGSNAAGDAETVDDVLDTLQWMADHLNPAHTLCVAVIDGRPPEPYFQKNIDAKRAEYAARAALEHQQKGEEL